MGASVPEITAKELKALMDDDNTPFILDVRNEDEYGKANIGGTLIPLGQIVARMDELEPHKDNLLVVHCRNGGCSAQAVKFLLAAGFTDPRNLVGGTLAWTRDIDSSLPIY